MSDDSDVEAMLEAPFAKDGSEVGQIKSQPFLTRYMSYEVSHDWSVTVVGDLK